MSTQKRITINIDGQQHQVVPGATRGNVLHALANITEQDQLYLEVPREPDVPVNSSDLMFLRGGEIFSIGVKDLNFLRNPVRRNAITFNLNDQDVKLQHEQHAHAKATGAQIKALVGSSHLDLWADLEGIPDALVEDHDIIILQPNEVFFTVERDHNEEQDRFFEVIAVFNGEQRTVRLPMLMLVNEAIRRILPDDIRVFTEYYAMRWQPGWHHSGR
jgi:acyl transferase domain-containing protein